MRARSILAFVALGLAAASCGVASGVSGSGSAGSRGSAGSLSLGGDGAGPICGSAEIIGQPVPRVDGPGDCGIRRPVRIISVSGVSLSPQPTISCDTAKALDEWVEDSAKPRVAGAGERLASLSVAASYSCRGRNNRPGARLSEHAKGNAIDISALTLRGGETVTVARDWTSPAYGPMLKAMHADACGIFATTLGPGSDGYHEDHLHYDVAKRGSGSYCR